MIKIQTALGQYTTKLPLIKYCICKNFCGVKFCVIKIILLFHNIQGVKFSRIVVWYCVYAIVYIKGRTHGASIHCLSCQGHYVSRLLLKEKYYNEISNQHDLFIMGILKDGLYLSRIAIMLQLDHSTALV